MLLPNKNRPRLPEEKKPSQPLSDAAKKRLWVTAGLTLILLFIYYGCVSLGYFQVVMVVYGLAFAALIVTYLAYNRGFINKDVTPDMLPPDWSEERKQAFVEGNRVRAEKSRWMVTLIIPFVMVFMCEALYLFLWDGLLSGLFQ